MNLCLWAKPERPKLALSEIVVDAEEREWLFRLLHLVDSLRLERGDSLENAREASRISQHFADRHVYLPWDVDQLKAML